MLSLPGDLHFLVVTDTVSEDVDLQKKHRWTLWLDKIPHARPGTWVRVNMHHCSFLPTNSCVGFSTGL